MAKRQNRPEDFTLPLVEKFLPPDLADGATVEFCEWVQNLKRYGSPLQFENAHALLWGIKTVFIYEKWRFLDWLGSLRREQFTAANLEQSFAFMYGRNYATVRCCSDMAIIALQLYFTAWMVIFIVIFWRGLPRGQVFDVGEFIFLTHMCRNIAFALFVSLIPFVKYLCDDVHRSEYIHREATRSIVGVVAGMLFPPIIFLAYWMPSVFYDKVVVCLLLVAAANGLLRRYISRSIEFRTEAQAGALQTIFDQGSGEGGWYSGKKGARNLLPTTKPHNDYDL